MKWHTYDFFDPSDSSQYWTSTDGAPPPNAVRELAEILPARLGTIACNGWSPADYVGGLRIHDGTVAVFRVFNGGRDRRGRPHRWVLLAASVPVADCRGLDIIAAIESPTFLALANSLFPSPAICPSGRPVFRMVSPIGNLPAMGEATGDVVPTRAREVSSLMTSAGADGLILIEKFADVWRMQFQLDRPPPSPPSGTSILGSAPMETRLTEPGIVVPRTAAKPKTEKFFSTALLVFTAIVVLAALAAAWGLSRYFGKLGKPASAGAHAQPPNAPSAPVAPAPIRPKHRTLTLKLPMSAGQDDEKRPVQWLRNLVAVSLSGLNGSPFSLERSASSRLAPESLASTVRESLGQLAPQNAQSPAEYPSTLADLAAALKSGAQDEPATAAHALEISILILPNEASAKTKLLMWYGNLAGYAARDGPPAGAKGVSLGSPFEPSALAGSIQQDVGSIELEQVCRADLSRAQTYRELHEALLSCIERILADK